MANVMVGWGGAFRVRVVLALAACVLALLGSHGAGAGGITVSGEDLTAAPGGAVAFTISGHSAETIGAYGIEVFFDEDLVSPYSCQVNNAICNTDPPQPGHLRLSSASVLGISGDITFATIVFEATGPPGTVAPVAIEVTALADTVGLSLMDEVTVTDGSITFDESQPTPPGDANCDAGVDAADSLAIIGELAGASEADCLAAADVNCDGRVDANDALAILRFIGGLPLALPPGCDALA
jgi:hypothetical protein